MCLPLQGPHAPRSPGFSQMGFQGVPMDPDNTPSLLGWGSLGDMNLGPHLRGPWPPKSKASRARPFAGLDALNTALLNALNKDKAFTVYKVPVLS